MMKRSTLALLVAAMLPLPALADPYVIIGGAFGNVDLNQIKDLYPAGSSVDDNVSRVIAGIGARVNANLGVEASYMSNSDNSVSNGGFKDTFSHDGYQFAVLGYLPVAQNVDLFAKVSGNYMHTDYTTNDVTLPSGYYSESHDKMQFGYGGGVELNVAQNISLRLTLEQIQLQHVVNSSALNGGSGNFNVNQGSLGLMMYF
jgi:opacity protein-like surface antigen